MLTTCAFLLPAAIPIGAGIPSPDAHPAPAIGIRPDRLPVGRATTGQSRCIWTPAALEAAREHGWTPVRPDALTIGEVGALG
jgi:hypothetical protein